MKRIALLLAILLMSCSQSHAQATSAPAQATSVQEPVAGITVRGKTNDFGVWG